MSHFAIINGRNVVSVIVADDLETANEHAIKAHLGEFAIQVPNEPNAPGLGWVWDGTNLINPVVPE
jgi:hypothetical protein